LKLGRHFRANRVRREIKRQYDAETTELVAAANTDLLSEDSPQIPHVGD
jgi:hypothetical protein